MADSISWVVERREGFFFFYYSKRQSASPSGLFSYSVCLSGRDILREHACRRGIFTVPV